MRVGDAVVSWTWPKQKKNTNPLEISCIWCNKSVVFWFLWLRYGLLVLVAGRKYDIPVWVVGRWHITSSQCVWKGGREMAVRAAPTKDMLIIAKHPQRHWAAPGECVKWTLWLIVVGSRLSSTQQQQQGHEKWKMSFPLLVRVAFVTAIVLSAVAKLWVIYATWITRFWCVCVCGLVRFVMEHSVAVK